MMHIQAFFWLRVKPHQGHTLPDPIILYSTITKLAYQIGERYYGSLHYVWCAPTNADPFKARNPPSSDPLKLYWRLYKDVMGGDNHSSAVQQNRLGLVRGANAKAANGMISTGDRDVIEAIVDLASLHAFLPLFLVIPFYSVKRIATPAAIKDRANPTSEEYVIAELPRDMFDILQINE